MSFDKLLSELQQLQSEQEETMSKALPADDGKDDEKIQAAAEEGGAMDASNEPDGDEGADAGAGDGDGDGDEGKPMAKSFTLKLEDGTEVEATDGTELVKSLTQRLEKTEGQMAKALEQAVGLIKGQGDLIKSLTEQVKKLSGEGRGRKAVVSVVEKPAPGTTMAKSEPQGLTGEEFMTKAMDAMKAGKITSLDVATAEACLNRGAAIPASIIQRVVQ